MTIKEFIESAIERGQMVKDPKAIGKSPEEAVVKLWLLLNKVV